MTNRRRKGKRHRPFEPVASLLFIAPAPPNQAEALLARFRSALQMLATSADPGQDEFRDLADAINTVETLALEMGKLIPDEVMPTVNAAIDAMAAAAKRWRDGHRLGLSGPGLQAARDVIDIYGQCLEGLTGMEMKRAQLLTEARMRRIKAGKVPGNREVIEV